jgi:hypothetical protein
MKSTKTFTPNDYYSASLLRLEDLNQLKSNQRSIIFSLYCAGVAVECMLRAYITKYTAEFDSKHNLEKLFEKSLLGRYVDPENKEEIVAAVKKANKIWTNDLRYTSDKRLKRIIAHEMVKTNFKDINKYVDKYYSDFFDAADLIIQTGKSKWHKI